MVILSVLDLSLLAENASVGQTLENSVQLAQAAEQWNYHRFWVGEHHFVSAASSAPVVLLGQIAAQTQKIRLGSGAIQTGPLSAANIVEQFATLAEFYPNRIDIGLGRSADRLALSHKFLDNFQPLTELPDIPEAQFDNSYGIPLPVNRELHRAVQSPLQAIGTIATFPAGAQGKKFLELVQEIQAFLAGPVTYGPGITLECCPGSGSNIPLWIMGTTAGESAQVAGSLGLPFVGSFHIDPAHTLEAVQAYRAAFIPGALAEPYVMISAQVIVAETSARAEWLARSSEPWLLAIRQGIGATPIQSPEAISPLTEWEENFIADRLHTRFIGDSQQVTSQLHILAEIMQAQELIITTVIHDEKDKLQSYELLAEAWNA